MVETDAHSKLAALATPELADLVVELLQLQGYLIRRSPSEASFIAYAQDNSVMVVEVDNVVATDDRIARALEEGEVEKIYSFLFVTNRPWPVSARDWDDRGDNSIRLWGLDELAKQLEGRPALAARFGLVNADLRPFIYRLSRLHLRNVRGFEDFTLEFEQGTNTIFIGRNGTGKSTLLRAIALALAPPSDIPALLAHPIGSLIREGKTQALIEAAYVDGSGGTHETSYKILTNGFGHSPGTPRCFVCGYGIGRVTTEGSQPSIYQTRDAVASLFNYDTHLVDPELMLRRLRDYMGEARYERAMVGLRRALGLTEYHHIEIAKGGGVRLSGPGIGDGIPLEGWADGYRMTFHWLLDFYGWAMQADAYTDAGGVEGVLLVDELEQHLHPSMQAGLMPSLKEILPDTQVFATTHSPLVALGAEDANIVALHREGGQIVQRRVPNLAGYSAQDVLVEEALFGTDPYTPKTQAKLAEQDRLASIPRAKRTEEQRTRLGELASELGPADKPRLTDDPVLARLDELQALLESEQASE